MPARVLLLIPHPDDEVVGCAALITRARAAGARFFGLYLTTGVPAPEELWPWQRAGHSARVGRRAAEAHRAAQELGIEAGTFLPLPSRRLRLHLEEVCARVREEISRLAITALWVPAYEGGHQDHDAANCLAATLGGEIEVREFAEYNYAGGRVRRNEFPAPAGGEEEIRLDAAAQARKRALLALYRSERANLRHVGTEREAIRPLARYDYAAPPHPGTLFYARFHWVPFRHPRVDRTPPAEVTRALGAFAARFAAPRSVC